MYELELVFFKICCKWVKCTDLVDSLLDLSCYTPTVNINMQYLLRDYYFKPLFLQSPNLTVTLPVRVCSTSQVHCCVNKTCEAMGERTGE